VLLALACALAAGCTARQSSEQYEDRLEQAIATRTEVSSQMEANQLRTADQYDVAEQKLLVALDQLDADPPPRDVIAGHEAMVAGLEGLGVLLGRLGRCESLRNASEQHRRACRQAIRQEVYDEIRNDFTEANTIYRGAGISVPGLGDDDGSGDTLGRDPEGGDEL
jgi:hypothetical protein